MKQPLMGTLAAGLLLASAPHAFAMSEGMIVTKATQATQGLDYTLDAVRLSPEAVSVRMEIVPTGKLQNLKRVTLDIGQGSPRQGSPRVWANLETKPGKDGALVVQFQLAPDLADKCSIDLVVPNVPATGLDYEHFYAVELKDYVTDRQ